MRQLLGATQLRRLPGFGGKVAETLQQAGAQSVADIQVLQGRGFRMRLGRSGGRCIPQMHP